MEKCRQYQIARRVEFCLEKLLSCHKEYPQEKLKDCAVGGGLIASSTRKEIKCHVPMTRYSRPPKIGVIDSGASGIEIEMP